MTITRSQIDGRFMSDYGEGHSFVLRPTTAARTRADQIIDKRRSDATGARESPSARWMLHRCAPWAASLRRYN
jgi:hypothetical protein